MRRGWIVALAGVLAGLVFVAWLGRWRSSRAALPRAGPASSTAVAEPQDPTSRAAAPADAPGVRAVADARAAPRAEDPESDPLLELLSRIRALAPAPGFHAQAWPLVRAMADLAEGARSELTPTASPFERLRGWAIGSESDVGRVRAACLLALALADEREAAPTVEALLDTPDAEVERAAWLALALDASEPAQHALDAGRLHGPLGLRTFPVALRRVVAPPLRAAAIARAARPMSAAWDDPHVLQERDNREELFTRWVAVLAALAPAAQRPSPERTQLLQWLRARTLPGVFLREIAAYCLAQAAAHDPELVRELEQAVFDALREDGPELANVLVAATGRADLALSFAREILGSGSSVTDELELAYGFDLLRTALQAEDAATRESAQNFAVERLFANDLDAFHQRLLISQIESGGAALLLDVAPRVLEREPNSANALWTVRALGRVRGGDGAAAARSQLQSTYFRADATAPLKLAVLKALVAQDPAAGREFVSVHGLGDLDAAVRAEAQALLDKNP